MTNAIFVLFYSAPLADLYSLSYLWISGLSFGAAIVVGVIASFALGELFATELFNTDCVQ